MIKVSKYAILIISMLVLSLSTPGSAQEYMKGSSGILKSISRTEIVLDILNKDYVFVINYTTQFLDSDENEISMSEFKVGENINVRCKLGSNIAIKVIKGPMKIKFDW